MPPCGRIEDHMDKKKYDVTIAGVEMSILSDEREEFVQRLVENLDAEIGAITSQSKRCSTLDAAILVALDSSSERIKSEKRVRNLEAQIALYDANLRRMREENIKLKSALLGKQDDDFKLTADGDEKTDETKQLTIESEDASDKSEAASENADAPAAEEDESEAKSDKLRQIESLLRGKNI